MKNYDEYTKEVENYVNKISLKRAIATERKGKSRLRDRLVFDKLAWVEAASYISIIQSIVIFMALVPNAIDTINSALEWIGIPLHLPKEIFSVLIIIFIIAVFIFGLVAVRYIGTIKRTQEISIKMHAGWYLLWDKVSSIEEKLKEKK